MPRIMTRVNRATTNPLVGAIAGYVPPLVMVHHSGRRSGREYETPVVAIPIEGGFITPLPYGTDTDWCLNVCEAGRCELETGSREIAIGNPRVVDAETALPLLPEPLRPGLRLLDLPGYPLLDRADAPGSS